ncbi:MAG: FAD:protein FMN transferase [Kiritimatiellia bacterium]
MDILLCFSFLLSLSACSPAPRDAALSGQTMGTTYSIRLADAPLDRRELAALQADVDAALAEVNRQMSPYLPGSEISRFNRAGTNEPVAISPDFQLVARRALEIAEATGGAFDPTVGALVNLWGFGPDGLRREAPSAGQIAAARQKTGWRHLLLTPDDRLAKDVPALQLDLGAIAKGFGVDRVAELLRERGFRNFLVEIGGETLGAGVNARSEPWRVGVLQPDGSTELHGVVPLTGGKAIATSGDYRNFYRDERGELRCHVIDPRTAAPVGPAVASVSVLADDCLTADALATALFVLGPDEGLPLLAARFPGVEALFLVRAGADGFREIATPGFVATPVGRR